MTTNPQEPPLKQQITEVEQELASTKQKLEECEVVLSAKQQEIARLQQQQQGKQ